MSSDFNLIRAHFESALATLSRLNDPLSPEEQARLVEVARLAHGAGTRRLGRMIEQPYLGPELLELHHLEEQVRRAMVISHAAE